MPAPALISFKLTAEQAQALLDALRQIAGEDHFKHRAEVRAFYAAQTRALLVSVSSVPIISPSII